MINKRSVTCVRVSQTDTDQITLPENTIQISEILIANNTSVTHAGHSESVEASSSGNEVIRSPNVEDMQAEHEKSNEQTLPESEVIISRNLNIENAHAEHDESV